MPAIEIKVIKNVFSSQQKQQVISQVTQAIIDVIGTDTPAVRQVCSCLIIEVEEGNWGIGGTGLTAADVHHLVHGTSGS